MGITRRRWTVPRWVSAGGINSHNGLIYNRVWRNESRELGGAREWGRALCVVRVNVKIEGMNKIDYP